MHRMSFKLLIPTGLLVALVVLNPVARAVGLGPVDVESSLNQPLRAEIPLLSVGGMDMSKVEVGLASPEDFARVGIDRPTVLERLSFTLEDSAGGPLIVVTSEEPVTDPFLSFLVRVSWPQGRLLREYTVLLDPPVTAPAATAAPEQARDRSVERGEAAAPAEEPARETVAPSAGERPSPSAAQPTRAGADGGRYGPVASGETLWSIANRTRPDSSVSINQMMLALLRTNPDAFFRDNINALRRGAVLRVPDRGEVERLTASEAISAVSRQNELWQDYRRGLAREAPAVVAGGEPAQRAREPGAQPETESRLELVPPREADAGAESASAGAAGEAGQAANREELRRDLSRAREELLARREQNDQLDGRVSELEQQVERLQRLLELKNEELAALQSQDATAATPADAGPGEAAEGLEPGAEPGAAEGPAGDMTAAADEGEDTVPAGTAAPTAGESAAADAQETRPAATEPEPEPEAATAGPPPAPAGRGWMEFLLSPVVLGIAGLLLIGIGVAVFLHRRGSGLAEPTAQRESFGAGMTRARERDEDEEATVDETADEDSAAEEDFGPPESGPADYDEAALRAALEQNPGDTDTRLKLIRHYAATNQRDAFVAQAETLYAELADPSDPAWLETRQLGEEVAPDHALFGGSGEDIRSSVTGPGREAPPWESDDTVPSAPAASEDASEEEREPATDDLPDLDFGAPGSGDEPGRGEDAADTEAEHPADTGETVPDREYDLSDLEDEPGAPDEDRYAGIPGGEEDSPGASESRPAGEFDAGDTVEPGRRDEQEPLEFDLSDFESGPGDGDSGDASADDTVTTGMEAPEESAGVADEPSGEPAGDAASDAGEAVDTKLELAEAYLDMGDQEGAREMLEEVMGEGSEDQKKRAKEMLDRL